MELKDVKEITESEIIIGEDNLDLEITTACGADLMSDVLAFTVEKTLLLTGLTKLQVIRTADLIDLSAIIFVRGKQPSDEAVKLAQETEIPLLYTDYTLYESCGRLYQAGLGAE
ncbi:DRTGG domain-containing protein [Acetohalobium arabaticum]|uniref:DRTGG domain protein n=1 Tax=Acetohalobium arabaticum (strain ATCC 49924 / DSM 5501 / Z-7288) TaxID=574087 RepID=D9QS28_ACEAZ|nr:DRTGG domain-containing protein [Acetohalobium arabaticum]ADL13319.1 DRTGG domain protein [Acetohalobium arabaticum DSM 5501]